MGWISHFFHQVRRSLLSRFVCTPRPNSSNDKLADQHIENTAESFSVLQNDAKRFNQRGFFTTSINPSIRLRACTRQASLVVWSLWVLIFFCGWWLETSVLKSPIPVKKSKDLQKSLDHIVGRCQNHLNDSPLTVRVVNSLTDLLSISSSSTIPVALFPFCDSKEFGETYFRDVISSVLPNGSVLFPSTFLLSTVSLSEILPKLNIPVPLILDQFCHHGSTINTSELSSLLNLIYFQLENIDEHSEKKLTSVPYLIFYGISNASPSFAVLADSPAALISLGSSSRDRASAVQATEIVFSAWFETDDAIINRKSSLRPRYIWQFLLIGSEVDQVSWDFQKDVNPLFKLFLDFFKRLVDVDISSHVVLDGGLRSLSVISKDAPGILPLELTAADLFRFQNLAYGWTSGSLLTYPTNFPPEVLNFALYLQTDEASTVKFKTSSGNLKRSFSIPKWGTLAVPDYEPSKGKIYFPSDQQLRSAVSMWMSHWRELLELPALDFSLYWTRENISRNHGNLTTSLDAVHDQNFLSYTISTHINEGSENSRKIDNQKTLLLPMTVYVAIPRTSGITMWELHRIARHALWTFLVEGASSLSSLVEVLESRTDLVVEPRLSQSALEALKQLDVALRYVLGDINVTLWSALNSSREGVRMAQECLHDSTTTSATFFSIEYKAALYLPLALPFIFPLIIAWIK